MLAGVLAGGTSSSKHKFLNSDCAHKRPYLCSSGAYKLTTCSCSNPGAGMDPEVKCSDGKTRSCAADEECFATSPFPLDTLRQACRKAVTAPASSSKAYDKRAPACRRRVSVCLCSQICQHALLARPLASVANAVTLGVRARVDALRV